MTDTYSLHSVASRLRASVLAFVAVATIFAAVFVARPVAAAQGTAILADQITRNGCVVTIPVFFNTAGDYTFVVWDDGEELFSEDVTVAAGDTRNFVWTIVSNINQGAAGVGFDLEGPDTAELDPWDFEGSDNIAVACAASNGTDSGETTTTLAPTTTLGETTTTLAATTTTTATQPAATAAKAVAATPKYTG